MCATNTRSRCRYCRRRPWIAQKKKVLDRLYREQKGFYFAPDGPFYGKRVYCEASLEDQFGNLDHFRPKKGVTDFKGVVRVKNKRGRCSNAVPNWTMPNANPRSCDLRTIAKRSSPGRQSRRRSDARIVRSSP